MLPEHLADRLIARRLITKSGCWILDGRGRRDWYTCIRINKISYRTHRLAAELWLPDWNPTVEVLHHCDTPACYSPEPGHLFLGSQLDNVRDMHSKGRGRAKLSPADVVNVRGRLNNGESIRAIATELQIGFNTIWKIREGISWKTVQ